MLGALGHNSFLRTARSQPSLRLHSRVSGLGVHPRHRGRTFSGKQTLTRLKWFDGGPDCIGHSSHRETCSPSISMFGCVEIPSCTVRVQYQVSTSTNLRGVHCASEDASLLGCVLQHDPGDLTDRFQILRSMHFHSHAWSLSECANTLSATDKRHSI